MRIVVIGGEGFVGKHFQKELKKYPDLDVFVPSRNKVNILNKKEVLDVTKGADVVYNLVGIISGTERQFYNLHVVGTENIVLAAKENQVKKIVYISALGVEKPEARKIPYFGTKAKAENVIKQSNIPYVILRPSAMFGKGAGFLKPLAFLAKWSPIVALPGGGKYRLQLVAVGVTASVLVQSALNRNLVGVYNVTGPEVLTLKEVTKRFLRYLHKRRLLLSVPFWFVMLFAKISGMVRISGIITPAQLRMMRLENIGDNSNTKEVFEYPRIYFDPDGSYPLF